jgi:uncharacterized alkaline shock family protein YloU
MNLNKQHHALNLINDYAPSQGKTTISPDVLLTIARLTTLNVTGVSRMSNLPGGVNTLFQRGSNNGVRIDIQDDMVSADLFVVVKNDYNIREVSRQIQQNVTRAIAEMVGMQVGRVNIHIEDIDYATETNPSKPLEV